MKLVCCSDILLLLYNNCFCILNIDYVRLFHHLNLTRFSSFSHSYSITRRFPKRFPEPVTKRVTYKNWTDLFALRFCNATPVIYWHLTVCYEYAGFV